MVGNAAEDYLFFSLIGVKFDREFQCVCVCVLSVCVLVSDMKFGNYRAGCDDL